MRPATPILAALFLVSVGVNQVLATHEADDFEVSGWASTYGYTAGFEGQATVALPLHLGGRYNGEVHGHVEVCAERCGVFAVVDYCLCVVPESSRPYRVVDLSTAAWQAVTDAPPGLVEVTVRSIHAASGPSSTVPVAGVPAPVPVLPDTATDCSFRALAPARLDYTGCAEVAVQPHTLISRGPAGVLPHFGGACRVTGGRPWRR